MAQLFYTTLTAVGAAALSNALALGRNLKITHFAVGDGGGADYAPTLEQLKAATALASETYRGAVNQLTVDPENPARFYIEGIVPVDFGGWTVREAGWFLEDGSLFAVTKFPPSYKSIPSDGAATELPVRTYIATGQTDNVELKIDPTVVLATRDYADALARRVLVTATQEVALGRSHLFMGYADVQLVDGQEGDRVSMKVDYSVDLKAGQCRLLAPVGKKITTQDGLFDVVNFVSTSQEFSFTRTPDGWRAV